MTIDTSRFIVGIDLGTTNSALAYLDRQAAVPNPAAIRLFEVPQLTGPGELSRLPVLPSFLYLPGRYDIAPEAMELPWSRREDRFAGAFARDHGLKVPARLVSSAKSWLCHDRVDREAPILPWEADDDVPRVSPVAATAAYLEHLRQAWNHQWADDEDLYLEHQLVVITVPASFDEVARDLTLKAAAAAGLPAVILLEEPLAAFYSWLARHEQDWEDHVAPGELIVICDVGGGTTDFTLITLQPAEGGPRFERIAVGDHLILGGDNIDIALARQVARQLARPPGSLPAAQWKALCHQCRQAKERLLDTDLEAQRITVAGSGSRLIAGTLSTRLARETVCEVVLDGFFPADGRCPAGEEADPAVDPAGFGLPFARDPAITGHLLRFMAGHRTAAARVLGRPAPGADRVLFNGGSLKSAPLRRRVLQCLGRLRGGQSPGELDNPQPDLAVALGAAYYGLVRSGRGVRVGSGSPRAFYLGVTRAAGAPSPDTAVCLVERGLEEGSAISLADAGFEVRANQPVRFDLYSSSFRSGDRCGDLVTVDDTLSRLAPIQTVVPFGRGDTARRIPVQIEAEYTETGTLALWCRSRSSDHRWQLRFQLRDAAPAPAVPAEEAVDQRVLAAAGQVVADAFGDDDPKATAHLVRTLARTAGQERGRWPLGLLRAVADRLLLLAEARRRTPDHEARWLNLVGYCMRPGFGDGGDPHRLKQLWRIYLNGPEFAGKPQVRNEWWVMWRRVSGGMSAGQQRQFVQDLAVPLSRGRTPNQEQVEMWMVLASLERLLVKDKVQWGRRLLDRLGGGKRGAPLVWALGRLGARELFYGSVDRVIPPAEAARWLARLTAGNRPPAGPLIDAVMQLARRTGDRTRDLDPAVRDTTRRWLAAHGVEESRLRLLDRPSPRARGEANAVFGESLPVGLVLRADAEGEGGG